jgi:PKD repeat protein
LLRPTLSALSCGVALGLFAAAAITTPARGEDGREADRDDPAGRAEWNASLRRDSAGRVLAENRLKALDATCQMPVDPSMAQAPAGSFTRSIAGPSVRSSYTFSGTTWQSLGPQPMQSKGSSHQNFGVVAGRIDTIAIHPTNPNIMLLGGATGGIWKSTDGGATWRPVADTAPALAISNITFSPANPSIVFAATGEVDKAVFEFTPSQSLGTYLGGGLLKSTDSGDSWIRVDTDLPPNAVLSRVLPHPTNTSLVVVGIYIYQNVSGNSAYAGGLYRSTDGGVTFTRTFQHVISDLAQDPSTSNSLYLATGGCGNCGPSGVFGSTDFGQSWNPMFTEPAGTLIGNTKLGVSRTSPTVIYASFLNSDNSHLGIYRSGDAGANWTTATFDPSMCPTKASGANNQCSYDHWIAPDPQNPSAVYFGSIDLYKSTDGGASWSNILNVYGTTGPTATTHPDQHTAVFSSTGTLFIGNDGGIYRSDNGGGSFQSLNSTLALAQFNGVALHPTNTAVAMGGTQDNGSQLYTGSNTWSDRIQGDGGFVLFRRDSPAQVLAAHFRAYFERSTDTGQTFVEVTDYTHLMFSDKSDPREPMAFYPPAVAAPTAPSTVFFGTNRIWQNDTFGSNSSAWQPLTSSRILSSASDVINTIAVATDSSGPLWAGSQAGEVQFAPNSVSAFVLRNVGLPSAVITRIITVTADGRNAYLTFGGYLGLPSKHVFRTTDAGVTWSNISNNLPDVPILDIKVDPTDPNDIFLGSDVGVFRSTNGGATWATFNAGLPNVPIYGLAIHPVTNDLWAATYGRGVWRVTNPVSAGPVANFSFTPPSPSAGQTVQFTDTSTGGPTSWSWDFGDGFGSTSQSPTHVFATAGAFPVTLTVTNGGGSNSTTKNVTVTSAGASSCVEDAATMCLVGGRYRVTSHWKNQYAGGVVSTLSKAKLTDVTGALWIADASTYEYLIRFNTATNNGRVWIAIPTFTDVEFWISVTDTRTGQSLEYHSPAGNRTLLYDPTTFAYP